MAQQRVSTDDIVIRPAGPPGQQDPDLPRGEELRTDEHRAGAGDDVGRQGPEDTNDQTQGGTADRSADRDAGARSAADPAGGPDDNAPLLDQGDSEDFLRRWSEVQARFVDDPRGAVLDGDSLVAELVQSLASRFSQHKSGLEEQWSRGAEPSTEELRLALQQYRSFFQRLLAT